MSTIAKLNVMLTANIGGFSTVMRGAKSSLHSVGEAVGSLREKLFNLKSAFAGGVTAAAFGVAIKDSIENMADVGRLSDTLGISTQALSGFMYAAKLSHVDTDSLAESMTHLLKNLSDAATIGGPAADSIALLGFNAKQLASESPEQALNQIADGLRKLSNPADRARVAMDLFGRSGYQLMPLLMQGSAGIKAASEEAKKLGVSFNRIDAAKADLAEQAFIRLKAVLTGAANTLALQLAPFIEVAAEKLAALGEKGKGISYYLVEGFGWVVKSIAGLADYIELVEAGWNLMRSAAAYAIGTEIDGIGYVIDALGWLLKKLHITSSVSGDAAHAMGKAFESVGKDAFKKAGQNWDDFHNSVNSKKATAAIAALQAANDAAAKKIAADAKSINQSSSAFEDYAAKLKLAAENAKKVTQVMGDLQKSVATFGMTEGQKKLFDLKSFNATPEQLAQAQKYIDQLSKLQGAKDAADAMKDLQTQINEVGVSDSQKAMDKLKLPGVSADQLQHIKDMTEQLENMKAAQSIFDDTRSPAEKFQTQIGKLNTLLDNGSLSWDTYQRAVAKAREELQSAAQQAGPALMQFGSAQALEFEYQMKRQQSAAYDGAAGVRNSDPSKKDDQTARLQYNETYQSRLILQRIDNHLQDQNATQAGVISIA